MSVVDVWTGREAGVLRTALRFTNEEFAHQLGTALRTVTKWNADPGVVPTVELQRALDTMLGRASPDAHERFGRLLQVSAPVTTAPAPPQYRPVETRPDAEAEVRLAHDPAVSEMLSWVDHRAGWPDGHTRRQVARLVEDVDRRQLRDQAYRRAQVGRADIAEALTTFYGNHTHVYQARYADERLSTSILTRPEWLDLRLGLGEGRDKLTLATGRPGSFLALDDDGADHAVRRIAEALASNTRMVNSPLYQLRHIDIAEGRITGELGMTDFLTYALTLDLLQNELIDAIAEGRADQPNSMPLRQRYLPDLTWMTNLDLRLCAGGPLALFAVARPGRRGRPKEEDYLLLIQERSAQTVNAAHRLAVIPKGFHQPLVDFSDDAQISATLEREMEEELFGRAEVDATTGGIRQADPLHISRLSAPMRWLIDNSDPASWQIECTGFGINLVSGNFEFACLIVIHDETWWEQYGGVIEANWESERIRRYSTRDTDRLTGLVHDASWSNEGLFALLQGLRRLAELGQHRVDLPPITLEM